MSFGDRTEPGRRPPKAERPRPEREVGRLRTEWGGGVCLERGLDGTEEGRGWLGQRRGGQGRRGVLGPRAGRCCVEKLGCSASGMRFPQRGRVPGRATVCGMTEMEMGRQS